MAKRHSVLLFVFLLLAASALSQGPTSAQKDILQRMSPVDFAALQRRAEGGDPRALLRVADAYFFGIHVPVDGKLFLETLTRSATLGNLNAQDELASVYDKGNQFVAPDPAKHNFWLIKAATGGHVVAQNNLGVAYLKGDRIQQNSVLGEKWLKASAEGGFMHAQYTLGQQYLLGTHIPLNPEEGERWIRIAAEHGHGPSLAQLARLYSDPNFVPRDPEFVETILLRAAEMGVFDAQFQLGRMYRQGLFRSPEYDKSVEWYEQAAQKGYAPAAHDLGEMYEEGVGVRPDFGTAFNWYAQAAQWGYTASMLKTADAFVRGRGVAPDRGSALMWYLIAERKGSPEAARLRAELQKPLSVDEIADSKSRAEAWMRENAGAMAQPLEGFKLIGYTAVPVESPDDRPPSTQEERDRAVEIVKKLEQTPNNLELNEDREWLEEWMSEIPDMFFHFCPVLGTDDKTDFPLKRSLEMQMRYSSAAFQIQHPETVKDQIAIYTAGVQGTLRAYQALLAQSPAVRSDSMELLRGLSATQLYDVIHQRVRKRCR